MSSPQGGGCGEHEFGAPIRPEALVEYLPHRIFLKDCSSIFLYCNRRFAADMGTTQDAIIGNDDYVIVPRELADRFRREDQAVIESGESHTYVNRQDFSGRTRWIRTVKTPFRDRDGTIIGVFGHVEDISETERIQQDLEAKTYAIEMAVTPIVIADPAGKILYVNQAFVELSGAASADEIIGRDAVSFHPDPEEARHVIEVLQTNGSWTGEIRALRKDGTEFTALATAGVVRNADGTIMNSIATFVDITNRKKEEAITRRRARKFDALVESTMEGYWLVTPEDGRFLDVNQTACTMLGYSREELLAMSIADVEAIETSADTRQHIADLLKAGHDRFTSRHRKKDGSVIDVEVNAIFYTEEDQQFLFAFILDITDRKALERAEQARRVAEEANRAKSSFLTNVTHELRTPMNAILGFAQLLQMDRSLTEAQSEEVREIQDAGNRLLQVINGILDYAKIESTTFQLTMEDVTCSEILQEIIQENEAAAQAAEVSIRVLCEGDVSATQIHTDHAQLRMVLSNLLSNAVKYNRPGGTIVMDVQHDGTNIRFFVTDTGYGIPESRKKEIFSPFNRLGREAGSVAGTGIGLASCRRLIELMGGTIGFDSTEGEGSTFWIELPLVPPPGVLASSDKV